MTVRESGRDAVMVNCNPETVSTDYDTSDRLYFEPLTAEDVLAVIEAEQPEGVIVQFGGQTPLKLAGALEEAGRAAARHARSTRSTSPRTAAASARCSAGSEIAHPPYGTALSADEAVVIAEDVGFPLLVRPSYVLGGRAMEICYSAEGLAGLPERERQGRPGAPAAPRPLPRGRDRGRRRRPRATASEVRIGGIMQHVEEAGVHSGDSACVLPPHEPGRGDARGDPRRRPSGSRWSSASSG